MKNSVLYTPINVLFLSESRNTSYVHVVYMHIAVSWWIDNLYITILWQENEYSHKKMTIY